MSCYCQCHVSPYPADVRNIVAALAACPACAGAHQQPASHTRPRIVARPTALALRHTALVTLPDGRTLTWAQYQQTLNRAAWRRPADDGEGPEA